jgi:hypothetical protein
MAAHQDHSTQHHLHEDLCVPEQRIRERAYQIYQQRGARSGHAEGDWLTAEAELKEIKKKAVDAARLAQTLST